MKLFSSLRSRIWLAVGATALPIFVFSLYGHLERREGALREVERDMQHMLRAALVEERMLVDNAHQVLRIMARSNELRTIGAGACTGIARRLLDTQTNFANIGAALPDGRIFCSGLPLRESLSAADRSWFKEALEKTDVGRGHYQLGRITGQRGIAFGYPLRDDAGKLRAVLYVSTKTDWFERMTDAIDLPRGWFALVADSDGRILGQQPGVVGVDQDERADGGLLRLIRSLSTGAVRELVGRDGSGRIYGVVPLGQADPNLHLVIGAQTGSALDPVDRAFYRDLGVFALVFLASALLGWLEFRRSFVGWTKRMTEAVRRFGAGEPLPPEVTASPVRELANLSAAFVQMKTRLDAADRQRRADEAAVRESEQRLRLALETGNEGLWDWDVATGLAYFSPTWYSMLGYEVDEFPASFSAWEELLHPTDRDDVPQRLLAAVHGGSRGFEGCYRMRGKRGEWHWMQGRAAVVARDVHGRASRVVGTHVDVTDKRLREDEEKVRAERVEVLLALNGYAARNLEKEFLAFGLEAAQALTGSHLGFVHFINEDQEHLDLVVWSESTRHDCLALQDEHYPISQAGAWADCMRERAPRIFDDYAAAAGRKGAPPGHVRMQRLLTVPVIADDKVRAILGVANKADDYATSDVETLQLIGNELWRIVRASRVERSLAESERRLRTMLENVDMVAVILDRRGQVVFINDYWARITGWTVAEALGQDWFARFLPESADGLAAFEQAMAAGDMPAHLENEILTRDGGRRRIAWNNTLSHDAAGEVVGAVSLGDDVTEQRRSEQALAESWERFYSIVNTISEAIFLHEATTGRIVDVNDAAGAMFGYSRDELLTMDVSTISASEPPYTQQAADERMRRALAGEPQSFEWRARRRDGSLFWVEVNLRFAAIGGNDHVLAVVQDISERRAYEAEADQHLQKLVALNKKLEDAHVQLLQSEKMASIGQLAAGVAHEINNPVGYVYSNIGSLEKYLHDFMLMLDAYEKAEADLPAAARDEVERVRGAIDLAFLRQDVLSLMTESREGINRVRKIVQDLKDFSRVGSADEWQRVDLHAGLDSTLNIVWNELKYKTTVERRYGELPEVYCLPSQINQVVMNLLVNAAHAIETQGVVTLSTGRVGDEVWIEVEDNGSGILPENLKRIFDPFFTTKPVGKGTGLGLSVSYNIVQKHQGRIEVRSEVGKGTAFRVWLPIEPKQADGGSNT